LADLLHGAETRVWGDHAYRGQKAIISQNAARVRDFINRRYRHRGVVDEAERARNRTKSKVHARVEHPIGVIKRVFGFVKVRYRGLAKNAHRLVVACALANLFMARRYLLRSASWSLSARRLRARRNSSASPTDCARAHNRGVICCSESPRRGVATTREQRCWVHKTANIGSGSGRDTLAFIDRNYQVEALDASPTLAALSTKLTGIPTKVRRFQELDIVRRYDGIWACASLLHLKKSKLVDAFERLQRALNPNGIIYASFKVGTGERIAFDGRWFDMNEERLHDIMKDLPELSIIDIWLTPGEGSFYEQGEWLNVLLRKK
jgi:hypothetical protein